MSDDMNTAKTTHVVTGERRLDYLKALSAHMLAGSRFHEQFSFAVFARPLNASIELDGRDLLNVACGTMGCAAGELPALYPEVWGFDTDGFTPRTDSQGKASPIDIIYKPTGAWAADGLWEFFELPMDEVCHLFMPRIQQDEYRHDGLCRMLTVEATLEQVVENIDSFIVLHDPDYLDTYNARWGGVEVETGNE